MPKPARPFAATDGLCIACARGEVGEAVGRIGTADEGGGRFEGYTDAAQTEKKILRDVFAKGDAWFRTGDLMRLDEQGYFHFVDRVGDTFRWKGENVATSEVNEAVADCPGVIDATTYGVEIPGADGRAGMAAIVIDDGFDLGEFADHLARRLPAYACPVMIRICASLDTTETFKQKKQELVREGFDPHHVTDPLFFRRTEVRSLSPGRCAVPMRASWTARSGSDLLMHAYRATADVASGDAACLPTKQKITQAGVISDLRSMMALSILRESETIHVGKVKDYFGDAADRRGAEGHAAAARR